MNKSFERKYVYNLITWKIKAKTIADTNMHHYVL